MKSIFYAFVMSLSFNSNIAQAGEPDLKKACKQLASLRESFLEVVELKTKWQRLMKTAGIEMEEMKQMDAEIVKLKNEYNALAKVCRSAHASKSTFLAKLRGYEMNNFYNRLSEVMSQVGIMKHGAVKFDKDLQLRLMKVYEVFLEKTVETLDLILEKDPIKEISLKFEMEKALNDMTLILIEMLEVDVSNVKDVDTLLEKMKARIQELTLKLDLL